MALFDVPVHHGYKILTHTSNRRFEKNGFAQVGNKLFPTHEIAPQAVKKSSIYNKNISGISEAGYGRRYPYYGLSKYPGAGSPRTSLSAYPGAGSPRGSYLAYAGAGSPRGSYLAYPGAGSPRASYLHDAYVNDNPRPGTLHPRLSGVWRTGIPGRPSSRFSLRGLSDEATPVDTGMDYNLAEPSGSVGGPVATNTQPTPGVLDAIGSAFGSLFSSATQAGGAVISRAIQGTPSRSVVTTARPLTASPGTLLGMSSTTLLIAGGLAAYFFMKKN